MMGLFLPYKYREETVLSAISPLYLRRMPLQSLSQETQNPAFFRKQGFSKLKMTLFQSQKIGVVSSTTGIFAPFLWYSVSG